MATFSEALRQEVCPDWLWNGLLTYLEFERTTLLSMLLEYKETLVTLFVVLGLVGLTILFVTLLSAQVVSEVTRLGVLGHKGVQMSAQVISTTVRDDFWATVNATFPFAVDVFCQHHQMAPWFQAQEQRASSCIDGNGMASQWTLLLPSALRSALVSLRPSPV